MAGVCFRDVLFSCLMLKTFNERIKMNHLDACVGLVRIFSLGLMFIT